MAASYYGSIHTILHYSMGVYGMSKTRYNGFELDGLIASDTS